MASMDTKAEPEAPIPPRQPSQPPPGSRWRWPLRLLIVFLILLSPPAVVLACLAFQDGTLSLHDSGSSAVAVGCPAQSPPFDDCYTRLQVSVRPAGADSGGVLQLCCDFVAERQPASTVSVTLPGNSGARWSGSPPGSGATWTLSDIAGGGQVATSFKRHRTTAPIDMEVTLSGGSRTSIPLLSGLVSEETTVRVLGLVDTFAARLPPMIAGAWKSETSPARIGIFAAPASAPQDVVGRAGDQDVVRISAIVVVARSLLFTEQVGAMEELVTLGATLASTALPSPGHLRDQVLGLAQTLNAGEPARENLTRAASLIDLLDGASVSRLSRITEESERVAEAGQQCITLYQSLRAALSRLDAALTTYAVALPSGLLTRHPDQFDHGCTGVSAETETAELTEDWRALGLELPRIETALEDASGATADVPDDKPDIEPVRPARRPGRFLLSIASAAKSGARLDQLEAAMDETLAVRIGETTRYEGRDRGDVIRMLHRQWSHAGCWLYDAGAGAGTLTLHVEAQFPYLNHIAFRRAENGLITAVEITGVTLQELSRIKRENRGRRCQAFLDPARIADYALWLGAEGAGTRTPVDHVLRLLEDGPGAIGTLKLR